MKQVVRIERENGFGIFRMDCHEECPEIEQMDKEYQIPGTELYRMRMRHRTVLSPIFDPLLQGIYSNEFCGFTSIEQLQRMIQAEEFTVLYKYGFRVYLLEIKDGFYREGLDQVVFKKEGIVSKKDITQLFITKENSDEKRLLNNESPRIETT